MVQLYALVACCENSFTYNVMVYKVLFSPDSVLVLEVAPAEVYSTFKPKMFQKAMQFFVESVSQQRSTAVNILTKKIH